MTEGRWGKQCITYDILQTWRESTATAIDHFHVHFLCKSVNHLHNVSPFPVAGLDRMATVYDSGNGTFLSETTLFPVASYAICFRFNNSTKRRTTDLMKHLSEYYNEPGDSIKAS